MRNFKTLLVCVVVILMLALLMGLAEVLALYIGDAGAVTCVIVLVNVVLFGWEYCSREE